MFIILTLSYLFNAWCWKLLYPPWIIRPLVLFSITGSFYNLLQELTRKIHHYTEHLHASRQELRYLIYQDLGTRIFELETHNIITRVPQNFAQNLQA